jgi:hypothetical protein
MFFKKPAAADYKRYESVRYRPLSVRRRLLIVVLAVATAVGVLLYMLGRRDAIVHGSPLDLLLPADVPACKAGHTTGCVGGMARVIVAPLPAASAAPAPHRPASG